MADNVKLKAPKGMSAVSVLGQEYKIIKGYISVAVEHVEHLVGFGFTGDDGTSVDGAEPDQNLPAGVASDLASALVDGAVDATPSTQGGYAINQDAVPADAAATADAPSA
jgi:hypothetical protein